MKRKLLSMLLVSVMLLTLLPTAALAANTVTVSDYASLNSAFLTSASGTTVQLSNDISFSPTIATSNSLTLDLNGHTLTFTSTDPEEKELKTGICFTGTGTFTVKDTGNGGKITASQNYSLLISNQGSGTLDLTSGVLQAAEASMSVAVWNSGGTVNVSGATVNSASLFAIYNQSANGKVNVTNGTVSSRAGDAINNQGKTEISGGIVSSETGVAVHMGGSGSSLTISGGTVKSTSCRAIENGGNGNTVTVTGGTVQTDSGVAIMNFNSCIAQLSGGTVSSGSGTSVGNMSGGRVTISEGATVISVSGAAVNTADNLAITGGTVSSDSNMALVSYAQAGSEVTVSGGTISSTSHYSAGNCGTGKMTISGTAVLKTTNAKICLLNYGTGTAVINGGTFTSTAMELYNSGAGQIEINAGTYLSVANSNASGGIVINGGSVKAVQGATPTNSAGKPLSFYGITLTDGKGNKVTNTAVTAGELTFTPAVSYGFSGVKTDASGTVYLWLPSATTNANYKSNVSGGIAADKTSVLPNFTARVTVKLDGQTWNSPQAVLLSTSPDSYYDIMPADNPIAQSGGVYVFSGLDPNQTYYIWGYGVMGIGCSGVTVTKTAPNTTVNYYSIKVNASEGIDYVFRNYTQIQGTSAFVQANIKNGYTFDRWANTVGGETVFSTASGSIMMDGKKDITAYATLNTYSGSVTLNKDGAAWSASSKTVILSPSDTAANAAGFKTASTDTDGKYSFADLSPLVTYYVWMDGIYTGQTLTPTAKDAVVDYYSVTVTKGVNIADVGGGGVYRKGTEITVTATAQTGDYVFSRWQNTTGGALVSSADHYTFTVNGAISLTAMGGATKYTATVTLKKDGADWTSSPRKIVLSTSASELAGTVTGTVSGNTYTFSNLPGTGNYFVWDAETVTYANAQINASFKTAALDYYSVTVTPDSNIASVTGEGAYLKGSNVTLTATPKDNYRTGAGWTDGKYTINTISSAQTINPATVLDTYTGTVTVMKDGAAWPGSGKAITLSTSSTNGEAGKLSAFTALDPRVTYYIWADGVYTGRALSRAATSTTVDYYTVSVTKTNSSVTGEGVFLAGSSVTLKATPSGGFDFVAWYSGSTPLSTDTTYTIAYLSSKQELTAEASNTFSATVSLSGASGRDIKLSTSSASLTGTVTGTGSGPYTFSGLTRGSTYYVFDSGTFTGKTVTKDVPNVTLQYYTVTLAKGTGIDGVTGGGVYLKGSTATISATTASGYAFNGWSDGSAQNPYTITDLRADKSLTAKTMIAFNGSVSIGNGSIVIEDDTAHPGTIRIKQGGTLLANGDNLAPNTNIIITGTGTTSSNNITITATQDIAITLKGVDICSSAGNNCVAIADSAGNVTINLEDSNKLSSQGGFAAIYKGSGSNMLTINGPGSLKAFGGVQGAGIGGNINKSANAITINGGIIEASSGGGAGIGGGDYGSSDNIIINGGTITAYGDGGSGIGGYNGGSSGHITINGGTITASERWGKAGIGGGKAGQTGIITITGGNIKSSMGSTPVGRNGKALTLESCAWSDSLSIVDSLGFVYGMNGVQAIDGQMNAFVDRNTYLTTNTPVSATEGGITASASLSPSSNITAGDTITVTVTLSGTALKPGTYTLGLTGTSISDVATQTLHVTKDQIVSTTQSFTFKMLGSDVSDLALTLSFTEVNKHTVSFKDGTTLLGSAAYYEGESYTLMGGSSLEKMGYTFGGWTNSAGTVMGNSDVTHTVVWTPNTYKVVFHNDSTTTEQSFTYNAAATALNGSFTKTGYSLSGWATTLNGPKVYNVNASVQNLSSAKNGTADLYAVWQAQTYSVSFANGGGTGAMEPQSFTHGVAQELTPNALTRIGYTFAGWKNGATTYVNGQSVSATANMNLTAQWTPNSYIVVFSGNGANGGTPMSSQSFTYDDNSKALTPNTYTRTGYTFGGWNTAQDGKGTPYGDNASVNTLTTVNNGSVTLYAVWTPSTYTVKFDKNSVDATGTIADQTLSYDAAAKLTQNTAIIRKGYTFAGWNTTADGSGITYADQASVKNLALSGAITLYAMWTPDVYAITFAANGGTGSMAGQIFATGNTAAISANAFNKAGYSFNGWKDDKNASVAENATLDTVGRSATLSAQWTANTYTVAFNANGGANSMSNQSFTYDVSQTFAANTCTRTGYTFLGWALSPTAETADYTDGQSVSNLTTIADGTVTLYAVWKASAYVVRFDANGGSGDMLPQSVGRSAATALSANSYNRTGYTFVKWNTEPDGSGLFYADKQTVTNLPGDTASSITLYAQWTENARYNLSGTVKDSNDALLSSAMVKLMQGSTIVAQTKTGADGSFFFANLKSGIYNLVASKGGRTVTTLVTITSDTIQNVVIPTAATNNSVLVVTNEPKAETPELTVGGLDDLADAENADITMTVTAKAEDKDSAEQLAIKAKSGGQSVGMYLDMTVKKGSDTLETTAKVLEIVVPFNFSGKTTVKVLRYHGGIAEELEQLTKKPTAPFVDGKCFLDRQAGLIHVYTSKFSTYAVSYTSVINSGSGTSTFPVNIASSSITGGSVKSDKTTAAPGDKVTITVTPDKGYKLTKFSVLDENGKEITFNKNSDGTYTFTMPNSKVTVAPTFGKADSTFPFVDVPEEHWAYNDIVWVYGGGLMNGTGDGTTFEPSASTTRGMIVTVLWRMEGKPTASAKATFLDVKDGIYYAGAIAWAAEHKIVEGFSPEAFRPEQDITREQMAAILYRYAKYKGYDVSVGESTSILSYSDAESVSNYAMPSMRWACGAELINGVSGKLMPQGNAERCQVAAILHRFCKNVAK